MTTAHILRLWSSRLHSLTRGDESPPRKKKYQKKGSRKLTPQRHPRPRVLRGAGYRGSWPEPSGGLGSGAVAFSPSKNNSSEHGERRAPNWNQLSKLPAGSGFRSLHQPFWERAIKNSEGLKAASLLPVLPLPGEGGRAQRRRLPFLSLERPAGPGAAEMGLERHGGDAAPLVPGERGAVGTEPLQPPRRVAGAIPALSPAGCQHA